MSPRRVQMTPEKRRMARHALGLPNLEGRSYRNYYVVGHYPGAYDLWQEMVEAGLAESSRVIHKDTRRFWLTRAGAEAALEPSECLDPEDFPTEVTE